MQRAFPCGHADAGYLTCLAPSPPNLNSL